MNHKQRHTQAARERKPSKYLDAVLAEALRTGLGPGFSRIFVSHDGWCNLMKGRGECNCNPEISSRPDWVS